MHFSVIIPTHNRSDFLRDAIASALRQRNASFEIIISNDGSDPVGPFSDARVRIVENEQQGAIAARNRGIAAATGDAIALLDDDDQWTDAHFLQQAAVALRAGAGLVFGNGRLVFEDGGLPKPFAHVATAQSLEQDNTILLSAVCYQRRLHAALGLFDPALPFYADWDWYLRVVRSGASLHHLEANVVDVRVHEGNMSGETNRAKRQENLDLLARKHGLAGLSLKAHTSFA